MLLSSNKWKRRKVEVTDSIQQPKKRRDTIFLKHRHTVARTQSTLTTVLTLWRLSSRVQLLLFNWRNDHGLLYQHRQCFRHKCRSMCRPKALHHYKKKSMEVKKLFVSEAVSASIRLFHCAVGGKQSIILWVTMSASLTDRDVLRMNWKIRGQ